MPIHLSSRHSCKEDTRETTRQMHAGNGHTYLRQLKPKHTWKTRVPVFANGISKQSMWRALFFLFSPTESQPALGRPQLPSYIRLRQVAALSTPQEGLLTYFAPQPSWTTHFGRREKKQGGEEQGKKSPTEHYYFLRIPDPPNTRGPGLGELAASTEKVIIIQSLSRRPDPGLPYWSFLTPLLLHCPILHLQPPPLASLLDVLHTCVPANLHELKDKGDGARNS